MLLRYAYKELINNRGFTVFFILNLSIGLMGFIFLFSVGESVRSYFRSNLQEMLLGDYKIRSRGLPPENFKQVILETVPETTQRTETVEFFSMIAGKQTPLLFSIDAVQSEFPLYGTLEIDGTAADSELVKSALLDEAGIWLDQSSLDLLEIQRGDQVKVGDMLFTVNGVITKPLASVGGFVGLARNAYIGYPYADQTGLIRFGSRVDYETYFRVPPGENYVPEAQKLDEQIAASFSGDSYNISLQTIEDSGERRSELSRYVIGFLNMINLIALFLAGVGMYYLYKGYSRRRNRYNAIAMCIGMTRTQTSVIAYIQLGLLSLAAFSVAVLVGAFFSTTLADTIAAYLAGFKLDTLNPKILIMCFLIAVGSTLVFTMPILFKNKGVTPAGLFQENDTARHSISAGKNMLLHIPVVVFFWCVAVYFSTLFQGTAFILIFMAALAVILGMGHVMVMLIGRSGEKSDTVIRIARRNLSRHKQATLSGFTAIAAGAFLIATIPQIANGIREELESPDSGTLPSFFLFDIQPHQVAPVNAFLAERGIELANLSPMVRGRLSEINGVAVSDETIENRLEGSAKRVVRNGTNLSFRDGLFPSERITKGELVTGTYQENPDELPGISLEYRFADNLGVTVGDTLTFKVQGVPITGQVKNLRRVFWNSFQPNFFISFQPGVLEDAPHTFIANINGVAGDEALQLNRDMVREFPNISLIDVKYIVAGVLQVAEKALLAIIMLSMLAIFSGLLVIFLIAVYESREKIPEFALLKVVGSGLKQLRKIVLYELALPGILAAGLGIILSTAAALGISVYFFSSARALSVFWLSGIFGSIAFIITLVCLAATEKVVRTKPGILMNAD